MRPGDGWTWAAGRMRGTSHVRTGTPCQDMVRAQGHGGDLIALVSDGAGSATRGGAGAALACRLLERRMAAHLANGGDLPSEDVAREWIDAVRADVVAAAERQDLAPRDLAATLVACLARGDEALLMLVGDGAATVRTADGWQVPSWPEHGEYASTTFFLTDVRLSLRIARVSGVDALVLLSDGLERLALDFAGTRAHPPFFDGLIRPVAASEAIGEDRALSRALRHWLDSDVVNNRTDDDKAIVLAVRR